MITRRHKQAIEREREHFEELARERQDNGFVPDLRRMGANDYFYLSPFRRRELAQLSLGRCVQFARKHIRRALPRRAKVLDLCCGTGWFCLELARLGLDVTGVDLSRANIELAKQTLAGADLSPGYGSITYYAGEVSAWKPPRQDYDLLTCVGGLHHLINAGEVLGKYRNHLRDHGYFFCMEPVDENYSDQEAIIAFIVRLCLSCNGGWFREIRVPRSREELAECIRRTQREYQTWSDDRERGNQSPLNNASHGATVWELVNRHFRRRGHAATLPLAHRLIGGTRLGSDKKNFAFAKAWMLIEQFLVRKKMIRPGGFLFWGQKESAP